MWNTNNILTFFGDDDNTTLFSPPELEDEVGDVTPRLAKADAAATTDSSRPSSSSSSFSRRPSGVEWRAMWWCYRVACCVWHDPWGCSVFLAEVVVSWRHWWEQIFDHPTACQSPQPPAPAWPAPPRVLLAVNWDTFAPTPLSSKTLVGAPGCSGPKNKIVWFHYFLILS